MNGITAILLAGGASARFGREKPLLEIGGETLLERHLRQLRAIGVGSAVVVCSRSNLAAIRGRLQPAAGSAVECVLQQGPGMSGAVLTGLDAVPCVPAVYVVCVNDLVRDSAYYALEQAGEAGADIVIPTRLLDRPFAGGRLHFIAGTSRVTSIEEKPPGGCPPGSAANIMIHRLAGRALLEALAADLRAGSEYEAALTSLIAAGAVGLAVWVDAWVAIKTPADYELAQSVLSRNRGAERGSAPGTPASCSGGRGRSTGNPPA